MLLILYLIVFILFKVSREILNNDFFSLSENPLAYFLSPNSTVLLVYTR